MNKAINKKSFLKKIYGKRYKIIIAGILAIAVVHFAVQLSFIRSENSRSDELTAQIEGLKSEVPPVEVKQPDSRIIDIKPEEYEVRKVKVVTIPEYVQPAPRRQVEIVQPQPKKKPARETKAERLRRAERILTGI